MIRTLSAAALALLVAAPLAAQAPDGWQSRVDRSTNAADPDNVPEVTIRPAASTLTLFGFRFSADCHASVSAPAPNPRPRRTPVWA